MKRKDIVLLKWAYSKMGTRCGNQAVARAIQPERDESTLDKIWDLVPEYVGKTIRRRNGMTVAVSA
jgi:hypothetical protein